MILIYDCETTGLPLFDKPSDDPAQPHIIQLAALLVDDHLNLAQEFEVTVKPEGWEVPADITTLTGITTQTLNETGLPLEEAINMFLAFANQSHLQVGHNESFDRRMVRISLKRLKMPEVVCEEWKNRIGYDTCLEGQKVIGSKRPKLSELYRYFTGKDPDVSHSAKADCLTTLAVYRALTQKTPKFDKYAALRVAK